MNNKELKITSTTDQELYSYRLLLDLSLPKKVQYQKFDALYDALAGEGVKEVDLSVVKEFIATGVLLPSEKDTKAQLKALRDVLHKEKVEPVLIKDRFDPLSYWTIARFSELFKINILPFLTVYDFDKVESLRAEYVPESVSYDIGMPDDIMGVRQHHDVPLTFKRGEVMPICRPMSGMFTKTQLFTNLIRSKVRCIEVNLESPLRINIYGDAKLEDPE